MHIYLRYIFILYCMYCQTIVLPQRSDFGTCYTYIRKKSTFYTFIYESDNHVTTAVYNDKQYVDTLKYLLDSLADRLVPGLPPISSQDDLWIVPRGA